MNKAILVIDIPDDRKPEEYTVDRIWEYVPDEDDDRPYALYMGRKKVLRFKPMPHELQADWYTDGYKEGFNACLKEITE